MVNLSQEVNTFLAYHEACIAEMEALRELEVKEAKVFGDLTLVIAQAKKLWKVKKNT